MGPGSRSRESWQKYIEALLWRALSRRNPVGLSVDGEITLTGNAAATVLVVQNAWLPFATTAGWAADLAPQHMTLNLPAGTISPNLSGRFFMAATVAFTSPAGPELIEFAMFKNGAPIPDHIAVTWTDTNAFPNTVTLTGIDDIAAGDVVDLRARCTTAPNISVTVTDCNFSVG